MFSLCYIDKNSLCYRNKDGENPVLYPHPDNEEWNLRKLQIKVTQTEAEMSKNVTVSWNSLIICFPYWVVIGFGNNNFFCLLTPYINSQCMLVRHIYKKNKCKHNVLNNLYHRSCHQWGMPIKAHSSLTSSRQHQNVIYCDHMFFPRLQTVIPMANFSRQFAGMLEPQ